MSGLKVPSGDGAQLGRATVRIVVALLFALGSRQDLAAPLPTRPQRGNTGCIRSASNSRSDLG